MRRSTLRRSSVLLFALTFALTLVSVNVLIANERHTGTVLNVETGRLVVLVLGRAGKEEKLRVAVTPQTRIVDSERNPRPTSVEELFTDRPISLNELKKGDFVVVETSGEGKKLVADSVMVTLRNGGH